MPRPGPRPYECVRRAWHSDRHQPMRGSLIQEIFRVANEIHSITTKKNKEWQDKLPIVVLRAEEIMYSKANSEVEYMDLKTLWDRASDAINTIVRIDETTETGVFLQPCIEAALNLGCMPRRASRSQRNNTPSCYLSATSPEHVHVPSSNIDNTTHRNNATRSPFTSHYSNFVKPATINSTHFGFDSHKIVDKHFTSPENYPPSRKTQCSSFPLYYGDRLQCKEFDFGFSIPTDMGVEKNAYVSNKTTPKDISKGVEKQLGTGCDLSLRLGPLVVPCISFENSWPQENEDVCSSTSREGSKLSDSSPQMDNDFSFFPKDTFDDPLESRSSKLSFETEILNIEKHAKKRKAVLCPLPKGEQFRWPPKVPPYHFKGRMSSGGS